MSFSLSRTLRVLRLPLFCVLLWWVGVGSAQAAITCTAQMSDLNFGTVDLVDGSTPPSPTATLDYTCTNNGTSAETVRVCFNIGDGDEGLTNFNPRVMKSGTNSLKFQLYQGTSNVIWGSSGNGVVPNPFIATFSVPRRISSTVPASVSASTTMRGDLLAGQGTALRVPTRTTSAASTPRSRSRRARPARRQHATVRRRTTFHSWSRRRSPKAAWSQPTR